MYEQVVWAWDAHSDRVCFVGRAQSVFDGGGIVAAKPYLFEKGSTGGNASAAEKTASSIVSEKYLYQDCRNLSSSGNKPVDANFSITMNAAVDSVLYYTAGIDSGSPFVRSDLFFR